MNFTSGSSSTSRHGTVLNRTTSLLAFLIAVFVCASASAATVPEMTIEELTYASDSVVVGQVVSVSAKVEGRWVVSTISIAVEDVWKGKSVDMLEIKQRGGRTAELATVVPGMPNYAIGERAVLFLEARDDGRFVVTGLAQGKRTIAKAPNGTNVVLPSHDHEESNSLPSVGPIRLPATHEVWSVVKRLDALRNEVRNAEAQ